MASYAGMTLERPELQWQPDARPTLYSAVAGILDAEVEPHVDSAFARAAHERHAWSCWHSNVNIRLARRSMRSTSTN